ncbi:MAG TPA: DUF4386 domain-containing protein [Phototrophicaceae bacterium]|jgi:hypothetical protein|nr:DUF4386 domain-containing protein [Phototrophicaceae bacterium]
MTLLRIAGFAMIALPVAFNLVFFALGRAFEYPDILRKSDDYILKRFVEGGSRLIRLWYAFGLTSLLAIPLALLLNQVFIDLQPQLAPLASASVIFGTLSGLVQAMGLFRWVFLVPALAAQYNADTATPVTREAVSVVFHAFHQYIGVAVGEHLGYLFTGTWTILLSLMMFQVPLFGPVLAIFGIMAAVGIMTGMLEPAGWKPAGAINALSYVAWSLWMIIAGVILFLA